MSETLRKKVLVCGSTGFIGRNIVEALSRNSAYEVYGVFHENAPFENPKIEYIAADLRNYQEVVAAVQGKDIVIHYAARVSNITSEPQMTENVVMTLHLLKAAVEARVEHFIFPSCGYLYNNREEVFRETDIDFSNLPNHYYAATWSKIYCERMCEYFSKHGITKFTVIRQSNVYGCYDKLNLDHSHALSSLIMKAVKAKEAKLEVWGDGSQKKDMIFVGDLVRFIELIIKVKKNSFDLINIGSGEFVTIKEIALMIIDVSEKPLELVFDVSKPSTEISWRISYDLANKEFGWSPQVSIFDGIRKTYQWYNSTLNNINEF